MSVKCILTNWASNSSAGSLASKAILKTREDGTLYIENQLATIDEVGELDGYATESYVDEKIINTDQLADKSVTSEKIADGIISNENLLDNWYFTMDSIIDQRGGYVALEGTPYYSDISCSTEEGTFSANTNLDLTLSNYGSVTIDDVQYYIPLGGEGGLYVPYGVTYYKDAELTESLGAVAGNAPFKATEITDTYIKFRGSSGTYYINPQDAKKGALRGYQPKTNSYTIDRWWTGYTGTLLIEKNKLYCEQIEGASSGFSIRQVIDLPVGLLGKTLTLSVLLGDDDIAQDVVLSLYSADAASSATNIQIARQSWNNVKSKLLSCSATITEETLKKPYLMISVGGQGAWSLKAVKLEVGVSQTLAHQDESGNWILNDPPPNKALELLKCQRYFYKLQAGTALNAIRVDRTAAGNTTQVSARIFLPVPMRAQPALSYSSLNDFVVSELLASTGVAPTRMTRYQFDAGNLIQTVVCNGSYTTGQDYSFIINKGGWISFSAEP